MTLHHHDPGAYGIKLYDELGRKVSTHVATGVLEAEKIGKAWDGGSYIVTLCVQNSKLPNIKRYQRRSGDNAGE